MLVVLPGNEGGDRPEARKCLSAYESVSQWHEFMSQEKEHGRTWLIRMTRRGKKSDSSCCSDTTQHRDEEAGLGSQADLCLKLGHRTRGKL